MLNKRKCRFFAVLIMCIFTFTLGTICSASVDAEPISADGPTVKAVEAPVAEEAPAAAPVVAAPVAAAAPAEEANNEPTEVTVVITDAGASKVQVIKAVREITGLGLIDAKKLVDATPATVKENIAPEEADKIKEALVAAGATVEIK